MLLQKSADVRRALTVTEQGIFTNWAAVSHCKWVGVKLKAVPLKGSGEVSHVGVGDVSVD